MQGKASVFFCFKKLGLLFKNAKYFRKDNHSIKVYPHIELAEIFKQLITFGITIKVWGFKGVIQIVDGYLVFIFFE